MTARATIYNASAGSGKTYTLAYNYVRDAIEEPLAYRNILAVTFTNKATEEMKRRILGEIHLLAAGSASNYLESLRADLALSEKQIRANALKVRGAILHDYSRFTILTIDRFFQRIIRAFIQELGIDINYNIELDPNALLSQSADRIIEQVAQNDELKRWISEFIEERIEDGRSWDIHEGVLSLGGEIFKESARERLDSFGSKRELKAIVDKFTRSSEVTKKELRKVGEEALEIIAGAGLTVESFSGASRSFAKYFGAIAAGELKEPTATVRTKAQTIEGWGKGAAVAAAAVSLQPKLQRAVDLFDQNIKQWNTAALLRENYRSFALLGDLYNMVKQVSCDQNLMLLSETKLILSEFIAQNDAPFIYEKVGSRFDRYMIDEFQDTSLKEWNNFLPLLRNAMSQREKSSVLIVGDIKQSIYRWRGGDWRILHKMAREDMGESSTEVINLKSNFRSLHNIVKFNNSIIEAVVSADNVLLNAKISEAFATSAIDSPTLSELENMLQDAYTDHAQSPRKEGSNGGYVELTIHDEEPQIVERIKEVLDQGFRPCDILILVRSNSEGVKVASRLLEFKGSNSDPNYYFDVMTQEALVVGTAPISQFVVAVLRLALNAEDSIQLAIYNRFLASDSFNTPLSEERRAELRSIRLLSTEEAFEKIVMIYGLDQSTANIAYLQAIHESICGFCSSKSGDISQFLKWWDEHGAQRSISVEQSDKSIEITTIHKAKGLEKPVVMIPYCSWTLDPKSGGGVKSDAKKVASSNAVWAQASESLDQLGAFPVKYKKAMGASLFSAQYYREVVYAHIDNINMLYVALTRASESLHIFIKRGKLGVGRAIADLLPAADGPFTLGQIEGVASTHDSSRTFAFGAKGDPLPPKGGGAGDLYIMDSYPTAEADLRLRLPSQRYFEQDDSTVELTPRGEGVLMHKVFAEAQNAAQIEERLSTMLVNGQLSAAEHQKISARLRQALSSDPIKEWFSSSWDRLYIERDIILPGSSRFKRPDRVMTRGKEAVVVDYKFGERELPDHRKQLEEYKSLLAQMGYIEVKGYLWYIKSGKIVLV